MPTLEFACWVAIIYIGIFCVFLGIAFGKKKKYDEDVINSFKKVIKHRYYDSFVWANSVQKNRIIEELETATQKNPYVMNYPEFTIAANHYISKMKRDMKLAQLETRATKILDSLIKAT